MQVMRDNQIIREHNPSKKHVGGTRPLLPLEPLIQVLRTADHTLSMREMRDMAGLSSTSVVRAQLQRLEDAGMLVLGTRTARSYKLTPKGQGAASPDEVLLLRCLAYLIEQLGAVGGELVSDLKSRLGN